MRGQNEDSFDKKTIWFGGKAVLAPCVRAQIARGGWTNARTTESVPHFWCIAFAPKNSCSKSETREESASSPATQRHH